MTVGVFDPTPEQEEIILAFRSGEHLVVEAGAGTGKTSTLRLMAAARPGGRGVYLAYNRAIADDARASFPPGVHCATAHSLAFKTVGVRYRDRLEGPRIPAREVAARLRLAPFYDLGTDSVGNPVKLTAAQVARISTSTVMNFCHSADFEIEFRHMPHIPRLDEESIRSALLAIVMPAARATWEDLRKLDGWAKFSHDHYLKIWQLGKPLISAEFIFLDEAQDANPVIADVVSLQGHCQRILVGDQAQAIYGWRGAVDAMAEFDGRRLRLSQSFRFGQVIADEANRWLDLLESDLRLTGYDRINSVEATTPNAGAVLCRSNAGAVAETIAGLNAGLTVALVGGGAEIRRLAEAAVTLKAGLGTDHPELFAFDTWVELQEYVAQDPAGSDLKVFVDLIDKYGPEVVMRMVDRMTDERGAQRIVSTAHKAKGREWESVRIGDDFWEPKHPPSDRSELMLAYVAVTRARLTLDRGSLRWLDEYLKRRAAEAAFDRKVVLGGVPE